MSSINYSSILCKWIKSIDFCVIFLTSCKTSSPCGQIPCIMLEIGDRESQRENVERAIEYVWKYFCHYVQLYMSSTQSYMTVCLLCMIYFICATTSCCPRELILTDPQTIFLSHCWKSFFASTPWIPAGGCHHALVIVPSPPPPPLPPFSPTCP